MQIFKNQFPGLLNQSQHNNALSQGLLGLGAGLLKSGGWSTMPVSTGQALGQALPQFQQGYNQSAKQAIGAEDKLAARSAAGVAATRATTKYNQGQKVYKRNQILLAHAARMAKTEEDPFRRQILLSGDVDAITKLATIDPNQGRSSFYKTATDMGLKPGTAAHNAMVKQLSTKPNQQITIGGPRGIVEQVAMEGYKGSQETGAAAAKNLFTLREMKSFLDTGVPTGKLADMSLGARQFFNDLGFKDSSIPLQEAMNSLGNQLALNRHQPGMGPMTDPDFQIYRGIVPGLKNTQAGNALIQRRMEREYIGEQMFAAIIKAQVSSPGGAKAYDATGAWQQVREKLDAELGELIPVVESLQRAEADPAYDGMVVMINGNPHYMDPNQ